MFTLELKFFALPVITLTLEQLYASIYSAKLRELLTLALLIHTSCVVVPRT